MAGSSNSYHEALDRLNGPTLDRHRAIVSLMEELEAVDWYDQRIDATDDADLAAILAHNRDEEKEHAAMVLEWLRRRDGVWDKQLRRYLFSTESFAELVADEDDEGGEGGGDGESPPRTLGIGNMRDKEGL